MRRLNHKLRRRSVGNSVKRSKGPKWKRRAVWWVLAASALFLIILPPQLKIWKLQGELREYQRQERALRQQRQEILDKIRYYSSDAYIEEAARRELGLVKPGEVLLQPAVPGYVQEPPQNERQIRD
ncbi:FtsB family cell division protein [Thermacetogenium phaeum]|uniref:FtsB family cell division protein n=1 Tax=Thermacetogenium phaeum TaxID=85874 RepID=UPI00049178E9|nr:septum formation initiator family protein [Thermacetogenium phaeum]